MGTRTAVHAGAGQVELGVGQARVVLGVRWARVERFYVWITECGTKAHELNTLRARVQYIRTLKLS